jgi:hypothetical protein
MRRRDDPLYVRSALATLAFYGGVLALCALAGYALGWAALALLAALLVWLYRGTLFPGAETGEPRVDVERLLREELVRERHRALEPEGRLRPERRVRETRGRTESGAETGARR